MARTSLSSSSTTPPTLEGIYVGWFRDISGHLPVKEFEFAPFELVFMYGEDLQLVELGSEVGHDVKTYEIRQWWPWSKVALAMNGISPSSKTDPLNLDGISDELTALRYENKLLRTQFGNPYHEKVVDQDDHDAMKQELSFMSKRLNEEVALREKLEFTHTHEDDPEWFTFAKYEETMAANADLLAKNTRLTERVAELKADDIGPTVRTHDINYCTNCGFAIRKMWDETWEHGEQY